MKDKDVEKPLPPFGGSVSTGNLVVCLPYPPSVNHYWMRRGKNTFISREGKIFRDNVTKIVRMSGVLSTFDYNDGCEIEVIVNVFPPDRRKRDIDNLLKSTLDALQHAGVYKDDSQISAICIRRCPQEFKFGAIIVQVSTPGSIVAYRPGECFLPAKAQEN